MGTIKSSKDTGSNQTSEARSNHIASVKDSHPSRDFFLGVEKRQEEESTRVELSFVVSQDVFALLVVAEVLTGASVTPSMKRHASMLLKSFAKNVRRQVIDQAMQKPVVS